MSDIKTVNPNDPDIDEIIKKWFDETDDELSYHEVMEFDPDFAITSDHKSGNETLADKDEDSIISESNCNCARTET